MLSEDEEKELAETRMYLLKAIRDKSSNLTPPIDALNYAGAYSYLVNAWLAEDVLNKRKPKSNSKRTTESKKSGSDS